MQERLAIVSESLGAAENRIRLLERNIDDLIDASYDERITKEQLVKKIQNMKRYPFE